MQIKIQDYGAACDGITDDTAPLQAALTYIQDNAPRGGAVEFPIGTCLITAGLTYHSDQPLVLQGIGGLTNNEGLGQPINGSTIKLADSVNDTVLLTTGDPLDPPALHHHGLILDKMNLVGSAGTGNTLLQIRGNNRWRINECSFRDAGIGIQGINGPANDSGWGEIGNCSFNDLRIGCDLPASAHIRGNWFDTIGDWAICVQSAHSAVINNAFHSNGGVWLQGANGARVVGNEFEGSTRAVLVDTDNAIVSLNNATACGDVIEITSGRANTTILGNTYTATTGENVIDLGFNTVRVDAARPLEDPRGYTIIRENTTEGPVTAPSEVKLGARNDGDGQSRLVAKFPDGPEHTISTSIPIAKTANYTIGNLDNGKAYSNAGATSALTFNLRAATVGRSTTAHCVNDFNVRLQPNGADILGAGQAGEYLEMTTKGSTVALTCFSAGEYVITAESGANVYGP